MAADAVQQAYLLRLWQEPGDADSRWRAFIQNVHSGEVQGFGCLEDVFVYLRSRTETSGLRDSAFSHLRPASE